MTATKIPTASGVSRLLAAAGHTRAVIRISGGNSGFQVSKCRTRKDAVKVHQYFQMSATDSPPERYRRMLRRYADAIEAAGYSTEVYAYHLIVTAKEDVTTEPELHAGSPCPRGCTTGYPGRKKPELLTANIDGELSCPTCWECFGIVTSKPSSPLAAKEG